VAIFLSMGEYQINYRKFLLVNTIPLHDKHPDADKTNFLLLKKFFDTKALLTKNRKKDLKVDMKIKISKNMSTG
jgi:hypothetical protein